MEKRARKNHMAQQAELALEIASLIEGALAVDDTGIATHLAEKARVRAYKLFERLEVVRITIEGQYGSEVTDLDSHFDNVVPLRFGVGE